MWLHNNTCLAFDKERDAWEKKCEVLNAQVAKLCSANKNRLSRAQSDTLRASVAAEKKRAAEAESLATELARAKTKAEARAREGQTAKERYDSVCK
eukprot:1093365-Rhodomonas_salina.1